MIPSSLPPMQYYAPCLTRERLWPVFGRNKRHKIAGGACRGAYPIGENPPLGFHFCAQSQYDRCSRMGGRMTPSLKESGLKVRIKTVGAVVGF